MTLDEFIEKNKFDFYKMGWDLNTPNEKIEEIKQELELTEEDEQKLISINPSLAYLLGIKEKKEPDNDAIWWDNFYSKLSDDEKREIRDIQIKQLNEKEEREKIRKSNKKQIEKYT